MQSGLVGENHTRDQHTVNELMYCACVTMIRVIDAFSRLAPTILSLNAAPQVAHPIWSVVVVNRVGVIAAAGEFTSFPRFYCMAKAG